MAEHEIKHDCQKCAYESNWYAEFSRRYDDLSKLYASACQCKKKKEA